MIFSLEYYPKPWGDTLFLVFRDNVESEECFALLKDAFPSAPIVMACYGEYDNAVMYYS